MSSEITLPPDHQDSKRDTQRVGSACLILGGASPATWWLDWRERLKETGSDVDVLSTQLLLSHLSQSVSSRAVIVVTSPVTAIARESLRMAEAGQVIDVPEILRAWMTEASQLVRVARLSNSRCKFFAEEDLWRQPAGGMSQAGLWATGTTWPEVRPDHQEALFVLSLGMARERMSAETAIQAMHEELLACCEVLSQDGGHGVPDPWRAWSIHLAERRERQLQWEAATQSAAQRARESQGLLDRLYQAQEELEQALMALKASEAQAAAQRDQARIASDAAALQAQQTNSEVSRLRGDLQSLRLALETRDAEVRKEREEALLRVEAASQDGRMALEKAAAIESEKRLWVAKSDELAATVAQRESEILVAKASVESLRKELLAASTRLQAAESDQTRLHGDLKVLAQREQQAVASSQELLKRLLCAQEHLEQALLEKEVVPSLQDEVVRQEGEIRNLLGRLHDLQEEVERLGNVADSSYGPAALVRRASKPRLQARSTEFVDQHLDGVHRHLTVRLAGAHLDGISVGDLRLRLVEHAGCAGLALFAQPGESSLVSAWSASGQEDGVDYMLLVPSDPKSKEHLSRLGASDWAVVLDAATLFAADLPFQAHPTWARVAARLCLSLADLPTRLRYDRIDVSVDDSCPESLSARFDQVSYGQRFHPSVSLTWESTMDQVALHVEPGEVLLPLAAWPITPDGDPVAEWVLPVGSAMANPQKRQVWDRLSAADRAWILALLDALPAVAHAVADAPLKASLGHAFTVERAARLHKEAHQLRRSLALRHRVQRLLHRGQ